MTSFKLISKLFLSSEARSLPESFGTNSGNEPDCIETTGHPAERASMTEFGQAGSLSKGKIFYLHRDY